MTKINCCEFKLIDDFYDYERERAIYLSAGLIAGIPWLLALFMLVAAVFPYAPGILSQVKEEYIQAGKVVIAACTILVAVQAHLYARRTSDKLLFELISRRDNEYKVYLSKLSTERLQSGLDTALSDYLSYVFIEREIKGRRTTSVHQESSKSTLKQWLLKPRTWMKSFNF